MRSNLKRATGFSLIEVLVALLILLIGLLGVVRMQLFSVQNNQGAYLRTQATYIASDMLDRMRSNRDGRQFGAPPVDQYGGFSFDATTEGVDDVAADPGCLGDAAGCDGSDLATIDMREIASHFANVHAVAGYIPTLPRGSIVVERNPDGGEDGINDEYVVTVAWLERDWDDDVDGNVTRADDVQRSVQLRTMIRRTAVFEDAGGAGADDGTDDGVDDGADDGTGGSTGD